MQSINAGFQMLKNLIRPQDGEKLSKASVLQQAVERIRRLEMERAFLLAENKRLEHLVCCSRVSSTGYDDDAPTTKHKKTDTESSDEGVSMMAVEEPPAVDNLQRQLVELHQRLECERQTRSLLEQQQLRLVADRYASSRPTDSFSSVGLRCSASTPTEDATRLCGSLEMIVEAIQHLEGAQAVHDSPVLTKFDSYMIEDDIGPDDSNSAHSTMFLNSGSLQLPTTELMRAVAAAEVLQCFSSRHKVTNRRPQPFPCILQPTMSSSIESKLCHKLPKSQQYFHNT